MALTHTVMFEEEHEKLCRAGNRDVHDVSKGTTLPIARQIVETYVQSGLKLPWFIDLLNINLNNNDADEAMERIHLFTEAFARDGSRMSANMDFQRPKDESRGRVP